MCRVYDKYCSRPDGISTPYYFAKWWSFFHNSSSTSFRFIIGPLLKQLLASNGLSLSSADFLFQVFFNKFQFPFQFFHLRLGHHLNIFVLGFYLYFLPVQLFPLISTRFQPSSVCNISYYIDICFSVQVSNLLVCPYFVFPFIVNFWSIYIYYLISSVQKSLI